MGADSARGRTKGDGVGFPKRGKSRPFVIPLEGDAVNRPGESNGVDAGPTTAAGAATNRHCSGAPAGNRKGWLTGLEPATLGTTNRPSFVFDDFAR
jgi:hypothetical protein